MTRKKTTEEPIDESSQRKIYVLPSDLAQKIAEFQTKNNYPSEVEAVRHLLNKALQSYQTYAELLEELSFYTYDPVSKDSVVKNLLMDHPLVSSLTFKKDGYYFTLENGKEYKIDKEHEGIQQKGPHDSWFDWSKY